MFYKCNQLYLIIWWNIIFKSQRYKSSHLYWDVHHVQERYLSTDKLGWGAATRDELFTALLSLHIAIINFATTWEPIKIIFTLLLGIEMTWMWQKELVRCHKKEPDLNIKRPRAMEGPNLRGLEDSTILQKRIQNYKCRVAMGV